MGHPHLVKNRREVTFKHMPHFALSFPRQGNLLTVSGSKLLSCFDLLF
jgi:hypothetical protein